MPNSSERSYSEASPVKFTLTRGPADNQLLEYADRNKEEPTDIITTTSGNPVVNKDASLTVGPRGPILLEDFDMLDELCHFNRERIPERVVHAKGGGAKGYFIVTNDITQYTAAKVFKVGKKTRLVARFSQVVREMGSADTVRDPRGFAIKFYTEDGIWDLVGNNTPVFFVRDTVHFPSFIHSFKRNPVTNLRDWDQYWDFLALRPETLHQVIILYSDRGIPNGYRRMHGYGSNTFSFINDAGQFNYCKFHYRTDQGIDNIPQAQADIIAGLDADYSVRDLYNAIERGEYPSWTLSVQIMTPDQANKVPFNPFDVTKTWPHAEFPLIEVGTIVLNENPKNYFAEVEQLAFSPAHLVPGIEGSPDRNLQGRLFSYNDAHRYRLGVNNQQLPINQPSNNVANYSRGGYGTIDSQNGAPNYHPNSFRGPEVTERAGKLAPKYSLVGETWRYDARDDENYSQPGILYRRVMDDRARATLVDNIVTDLRRANAVIQGRMIGHLRRVDEELGARVRDGIQQRTVLL